MPERNPASAQGESYNTAYPAWDTWLSVAFIPWNLMRPILLSVQVSFPYITI